MDDVVINVIDAALRQAKAEGLPVHTFALYYDHESPALSVCIDTAENSKRIVAKINAFNRPHFVSAVQSGNLKTAALWCSNVGRSLSLGDFSRVNLARTKVPPATDRFFGSMLQGLLSREAEIAAAAPDRTNLLLCCTGPNDEVEYVWGL